MTAQKIIAIEKYIGTNAGRLAMSTDGLGHGAEFYETDTNDLYVWSADGWTQRDTSITLDAETIGLTAGTTVGLDAGTAIVGKVGIDQTTDGTTNKVQARNATHGDFQANVTIQVADADVGNANPVPVSDAGGSLTIDQSTHDSLCANANIQVANADVSATNPVPVYTIDNVYEATLTLDTNAYADGDLLADTQSLDANAFPANGGKLTVLSVNVMDLDDNKGAFDLVLLRSNTSMGSENSAPSIADGDADEILDVIPVYSTDYRDIGGHSWASVNVGRVIKAAAAATALYVAAISRDTKTYTAGGLVVRVGVINRSA